VHPGSSYCTDISRCTVNKTLNLKFVSLYDLLTYCKGSHMNVQ